MHTLPRIPAAILRALLPLAERDEVLGDIQAEYGERARSAGEPAARRWLHAQVLGSAPALLRRSWWRGWSGFEPRANAMRPGGPIMERWILDLRYSLRRLRTRPTYALLAILTLALGVGGTTAISGIVRSLLLDPLPFRAEGELAMFWNPHDWNAREFLHLRPQWRELGFAGVAAYTDEDLTLDREGAPTRLLRGIAATSELFDVLGTPPAVGRGFQPGDDAMGAEPVVVLSNGLWRELGASPSIVGTRLRLDGVERTVVGVAPAGFWFPDPSVRVWVPRTLNPQSGNGILALVGRAAPGQRVSDMAPQLARLAAILSENFEYPPQWDKTKNAALTPFREHFVGPMRPALLATLGAMAVILLIACANVGALMLGQVEGRASELAVRAALGAERGRLLAQLVSEAMVIGLLAGAAGAALAVVGFRMLVSALPLGAWGERASLDWTLFAAAMGIALLAALAIALFPVLALRRADLRGALSRARTGGTSGGRVGLQSGLVIGEVALAVLLAAGAALLVRSVSRLYDIDPGFETRGAAVLDLALAADMQSAQRQATLRALVDEMGRLPGVKSAAAAPKLPLRGSGNNTGITIPGQPGLEEATTYFRFASVGYLETMGIELRAGRTFSTADRPTSAADTAELDVVINEALARKYFAGVDPVGRYTGGGFGPPERIIGVVADAAEGILTEEAKPARYYLQDQIDWVMDGQSIVLRMERPGDEEAILDQAREAVQRVAPGVAVQEATTLESVFAKAVGPARQVVSLLTLLTALALVLGAVGVYGVVAHLVSRRMRDWSIRVALGLAPTNVIGQVVRSGAALAGAGAAIGVVAALALARLLQSLLYGVGPTDVVSLSAAALALLLVGVLAALVPAIRASRVDPALVLREQ